MGRKLLAFTGLDALKAINARKAVYWPLFGALAMSAIGSQGLPAWRVPFLARTYSWNEAEIGDFMAPLLPGASLAGLLVGGTVSEVIVGDPVKLWQALLIVAAAFMPVATFFMYRAIRPYGEEVKRLQEAGL